MEYSEKVKYVEHELEVFDEVVGENPIEYQEDASPTVDEMISYFHAKGVFSDEDVSELKDDSMIEAFNFYYQENPVTEEDDKAFYFSEIAKMIASNDSWFDNFKNNFEIG